MGNTISIRGVSCGEGYPSCDGHVTKILTVLMWFSSACDMACACSVFSLAMMVRLLISYLLLFCRSFNDSAKSSATSSDVTPETEPLGDWEDMTTSLEGGETRGDAEIGYLRSLQTKRRALCAPRNGRRSAAGAARLLCCTALLARASLPQTRSPQFNLLLFRDCGHEGEIIFSAVKGDCESDKCSGWLLAKPQLRLCRQTPGASH